ncbi:MAG TPA: CPBP family intramembrane glutamic endopeptidase [Planctomycetaceae bacterium]|nr:CPBP family intramembrane glutamic endopeptidase [Planctomycetaceae bacterium]
MAAAPFRKPGPGLPEALGWTFGVLFAHIAATVGVGIVIALLIVFSGGNAAQLATVNAESAPYITLLLGGDQMLVLLATVIAVSLRFSRRAARTLNLTAPHALHIAAVVGLVLPLSAMSGELYRVAGIGWKQFVDGLPMLQWIDQTNTVEYLQEISGALSLPMLLLIVAVGPAFAEELVFRGVIGRGLVARWGLVGGVLMTSLLFAAVHMHPVHVVAVVPLGIAMHLIYLATRSFWAPVLLHFLNNAWASVASQMASTDSVDAAAMEAALSPTLLLASLTAVIVLGGLLYRTRTRYLQADGSEWSPGYVTVEQPPTELLTTRDNGLCSRRTLVTAGSAWAAFAVAFVAELVAFAR